MNERYTAFRLPNFLTEQEIADLAGLNTPYQKTLHLREIISQRLHGRFDCYDIDFWIVQKWGGIFNFRDNDDNRRRIDAFANALRVGGTVDFRSIASLSKIAAFVHPDHYFIYDSRAVFALDFILLRSGYPGPYFPIPPGRNPRINEQRLRRVIRERVGNQAFYHRGQAYIHYCELIKQLAASLYGEDIGPERLEMMLFTIAEPEIAHELSTIFPVVTTGKDNKSDHNENKTF